MVPEIQDTPRDASHLQLRGAAVLWLHDPDGMTDRAREELRQMIEVRR